MELLDNMGQVVSDITPGSSVTAYLPSNYPFFADDIQYLSKTLAQQEADHANATASIEREKQQRGA